MTNKNFYVFYFDPRLVCLAFKEYGTPRVPTVAEGVVNTQ
jgi:hypothetical protein